MARFSEVAKGVRARKPVKLPLPGAQLDPTTFEWTGPTVPVDVRVLKEDEYTDIVLKEARAFAVKRGLAEPEDGDDLYERGKMLHTIAITYLDQDSPADKPVLFFDGGWEQIHTSEALTPEVIGYLYLQQQLWQEEVSPLIKSLSTAEFMAAAVKTAGGDMSFFVGSRPGIQWSFTRTLASLHVNSLTRSLPGSQPSDTSTPIPS